MNTQKIGLGLVMLALTACASPKVSNESTTPPLPKKTLLVISKVEHQLAFVNPDSYEVIAKVPVGPDPHEVVVSTDQKTAYVSNTGSGKFHEINVIDLEHQKALSNIDTGPLIGPHGMAYVGGKLYFTAEGAKSIGRYDPETQKVDWLLGVGQNRNHMIEVSADQKTIFTTNVDSGTVSILENLLLPPPIPPIGAPLPGAKPQMGWIQTSIKAGKGSEGFDVSPDGRELWTADAHAGTMTIIDVAKKKKITAVNTQVLGISRLKFTPDGKRVLVSSLRTGDLLIYDAKTRRLIKKLYLGKGAAHILIDPDGSRAFVSCTPAHHVSVIDLNKLEVVRNFKIGDRPDGMDWIYINKVSALKR